MLSSKILSFLNYKSPYGIEGNVTPSQETVDKALDVLKIISHHKNLPNDVFRTADGGIAFHYNLVKYYTIEIFPDGEILVSIEEKNDYPIWKEVAIEDLHKFISTL